MSQTRIRTLELKDAIYQLYCIEGKSLNYISGLFSLNRKEMSSIIKNDLGYERGNVRNVTPAVQKRLNRVKDRLMIFFRDGESGYIREVLEELDLTKDHLKTLLSADDELKAAHKEFSSRPSKSQEELVRVSKEREERALTAKDLEGEEWKDIPFYEGAYQISSKGRVKSFSNGERLMSIRLNRIHNRNEVKLSKNGKSKAYKVYRLVAITFLENPNGFTTVNHIDGDTTNDTLENLEWASQEYQNHHKHHVLKRESAKAFGRNGRFKRVVIDGHYEFKTLKAAASFLGVSETQVQRYVSGSTKFERSIELLY